MAALTVDRAAGLETRAHVILLRLPHIAATRVVAAGSSWHMLLRLLNVD